MKNINYNFAFLFYDVNEKRVNKVFKICKKYLIHYQKSVFKGDISPSNLIKLEKEINDSILDNDFVCIVKLKGDYLFDQTVLCKNGHDDNDLII